MSKNPQVLTTATILLVTLIINFPVVNFLGKLYHSKCKCARSWQLQYLYFYIIFWYATSALQLITTFLIPGMDTCFMKTPLYHPAVVIMGVSYTFFIMVLWSYVEYLKESDCDCSEIKKHKYVTTFAWFFFLLYVVSVSYLGTIISEIAK